VRGLVTLTVVMGVILVGGTALLGVLIFYRLATPTASSPPLSLDEPPGTHIAEITPIGDRLALRLEGGGPDRVIIIDPTHARVIARIALTH